MASLDSWTLGEHRSPQGDVRPTYRRGSGPGVVLIHELPGITPEVVDLAEELVTAGFTVLMPVLFGTPGRRMSPLSLTRSLAKACTSAEFTKLARGRTAPVTDWLRSLARELHDDVGGPGVGALGMCFTGGYALAMMVDDTIAAPVLAQPATPFAVDKRRSADLGLSPADQDAMVARARADCPVMGIRYVEDKVIGTRFETLHRLLGDKFIAVDLPGKGPATLTEDRSQEAVDRVLTFFGERLTA